MKVDIMYVSCATSVKLRGTLQKLDQLYYTLGLIGQQFLALIGFV